jgi:hypothetical protein
VNAHLQLLLSPIYDGALAPAHREDLHTSTITDDTIALQKIRSIPLSMIDPLAGFDVVDALSGYLIPFPDPRGGWTDHVKMKVFNVATAPTALRGDRVVSREKWRYNGGARKYVTRRETSPRLFFPLATSHQVLDGDGPVFLIEGEKKSLAVAQLGLPAVGLESAWGWHLKGGRTLLPDFAAMRLSGRVVELVPDADVQTNPMIATSMRQLADALRATGARPRLVRLPREFKGVDDFLYAITTSEAA